MDSGARGEVASPVVFLDEESQALAFLSLRMIHDGAELFLLAEREGAPEPGRTLGRAS